MTSLVTMTNLIAVTLLTGVLLVTSSQSIPDGNSSSPSVFTRWQQKTRNKDEVVYSIEMSSLLLPDKELDNSDHHHQPLQNDVGDVIKNDEENSLNHRHHGNITTTLQPDKEGTRKVSKTARESVQPIRSLLSIPEVTRKPHTGSRRFLSQRHPYIEPEMKSNLSSNASLSANGTADRIGLSVDVYYTDNGAGHNDDSYVMDVERRSGLDLDNKTSLHFDQYTIVKRRNPSNDHSKRNVTNVDDPSRQNITDIPASHSKVVQDKDRNHTSADISASHSKVVPDKDRHHTDDIKKERQPTHISSATTHQLKAKSRHPMTSLKPKAGEYTSKKKSHSPQFGVRNDDRSSTVANDDYELMTSRQNFPSIRYGNVLVPHPPPFRRQGYPKRFQPSRSPSPYSQVNLPDARRYKQRPWHPQHDELTPLRPHHVGEPSPASHLPHHVGEPLPASHLPHHVGEPSPASHLPHYVGEPSPASHLPHHVGEPLPASYRRTPSTIWSTDSERVLSDTKEPSKEETSEPQNSQTPTRHKVLVTQSTTLPTTKREHLESVHFAGSSFAGSSLAGSSSTEHTKEHTRRLTETHPKHEHDDDDYTLKVMNWTSHDVTSATPVFLAKTQNDSITLNVTSYSNQIASSDLHNLTLNTSSVHNSSNLLANQTSENLTSIIHALLSSFPHGSHQIFHSSSGGRDASMLPAFVGVMEALTRKQFSWVDLMLAVSCTVAILLACINLAMFVVHMTRGKRGKLTFPHNGSSSPTPPVAPPLPHITKDNRSEISHGSSSGYADLMSSSSSQLGSSSPGSTTSPSPPALSLHPVGTLVPPPGTARSTFSQSSSVNDGKHVLNNADRSDTDFDETLRIRSLTFKRALTDWGFTNGITATGTSLEDGTLDAMTRDSIRTKKDRDITLKSTASDHSGSSGIESTETTDQFDQVDQHHQHHYQNARAAGAAARTAGQQQMLSTSSAAMPRYRAATTTATGGALFNNYVYSGIGGLVIDIDEAAHKDPHLMTNTKFVYVQSTPEHGGVQTQPNAAIKALEADHRRRDRRSSKVGHVKAKRTKGNTKPFYKPWKKLFGTASKLQSKVTVTKTDEQFVKQIL